MPSVAVTPASYAITWGAVATTPARETAGILFLRLAMGTVSAGPGNGSSLSVTTPTLSTQKRQIPIGEVRDGMVYVTAQEQLRQQRMKEAIETAFAAIATRDDNQDTILARLQAAYDLASAANDNANDVTSVVALANSYPDPANILTASNTGTIMIAAHNRVYGDAAATTVAVDGGTVTGLSNDTAYNIYYLDAGREGGAVTYQATVNNVAQTGDVHMVGNITVPPAGTADTTGTATGAPGTVTTADDVYVNRFAI